MILDLIYPPRCPICHDIVEPGYEMVCGRCLKQLPLVRDPKCEKCGKPVPEGEKLCYDCTVIEHAFSEGMGIFLYNEVMRKSMYKFKYLGRKEYGRFYGTAAWIYGKETLKAWNPEVIVPVPVHITRKRKRGYNQAEVISEVLGQYMHIPVSKGALKRCTKTVAQKELTVEERRRNLEGAFSVTGIFFHGNGFCWLMTFTPLEVQQIRLPKSLKSTGFKKYIPYQFALVKALCYNSHDIMTKLFA